MPEATVAKSDPCTGSVFFGSLCLSLLGRGWVSRAEKCFSDRCTEAILLHWTCGSDCPLGDCWGLPTHAGGCQRCWAYGVRHCPPHTEGSYNRHRYLRLPQRATSAERGGGGGVGGEDVWGSTLKNSRERFVLLALHESIRSARSFTREHFLDCSQRNISVATVNMSKVSSIWGQSAARS